MDTDASLSHITVACETIPGDKTDMRSYNILSPVKQKTSVILAESIDMTTDIPLSRRKLRIDGMPLRAILPFVSKHMFCASWNGCEGFLRFLEVQVYSVQPIQDNLHC